MVATGAANGTAGGIEELATFVSFSGTVCCSVAGGLVLPEPAAPPLLDPRGLPRLLPPRVAGRALLSRSRIMSNDMEASLLESSSASNTLFVLSLRLERSLCAGLGAAESP